MDVSGGGPLGLAVVVGAVEATGSEDPPQPSNPALTLEPRSPRAINFGVTGRVRRTRMPRPLFLSVAEGNLFFPFSIMRSVGDAVEHLFRPE